MVSARVVVWFVLAALGVVLLAGCQDDEKRAALPASAPPQRVVAAYIDAINAHDRQLGRQLSTQRFAEQEEKVVDSLFDDAKLSDVEIEAPQTESDYESPDGKRYQEAVNVPVSFTLWHGDESSMPNGPTVWGYILVRAGAGQPWRINDAGVG
ncbi:DUF4829 domain-containing protein [Microbispora sp. KK1-11]|uniref:DUF4829 domain-containing protein n=1 Tax=Microbispora sp. KK1-11 TaxID=2053005 RepID=UPI001158D777|nr:DUF4829 domain-containing protein [Microbispora sp. KK1-11]TQS30256.1 DUF4829 domain-containing protein [Microbispora sp. KK1-11]